MKPKGIPVELTEVSLARLYKHWTDVGFVIVSANRGERTWQENRQELKKLQRTIRSDGYGFILLTGHWKETDVRTGEKKIQQEPSLLVPSTGDLTHLRARGIVWAGLDPALPQESFIFAWPGGPVEFIDPVKRVVTFKLSKFKPGKVADIYSKLRKRPGSFVFEGWAFARPPSTFMEAQRRRNEGECEFISDVR